MPQITVINQSGEESSVQATSGRTLMETIRDSGFDELLALCGGCCSCATCHVHIDPSFMDKMPKVSEDENCSTVPIIAMSSHGCRARFR
jgi:2Fe-2S ferredoxin